uniref:hypothetical protein n=1 Tax=Salmonella sp. SAL4432 TaxID=3159887 RepID=UPI00397CFCA8
DDDDGHVVWVAISVTERPLPSAAVVSVDLGSPAPSLTITAVPGGYNAVSGHDPPRKLHDPRGPPELASA